MCDKAVFVTKDNDIAVITMDDKENPVNTWSDTLSEDFAYALNEISDLIERKEVRGVLLTSGKEGTFHTGGNLNKMGSKPDTALDKMKSIGFNHSLSGRISSMKVPVVAVINGYCLGGGLELALACTARIAADTKKTKLGLPEFNVGVFPAGGGTQRLPRLIGYAGIDFIVEAKTVDARDAYEVGILDQCYPADVDLLTEGKKFIRALVDGSITLKRPQHDFSNIAEKVAEEKAKLLKKTRGRLLPAPKAFFEVIEKGLPGTLEEGLEWEKRNYIQVALSPECKGTIHSFFLKGMTDNPAKMMTKGFVPKPINKAAVLGFGNMGRGIVICILRDMDIPVVVKDTPEALEAGKTFVLKTLNGMYEKKRLSTPPEELMRRILPTTEFGDIFKDVDLVIEAIYENIDAKKELYEALCNVVTDDCLIASNTSGLSINDLAKFVTLPRRFGGMHFFSPVWLMQLVELVRGENTSRDTIDNFLHFAGCIKKRPLVCNDSRGFVVNAVLGPLTRNGLKYIEEGNDIAAVDQAFTQYGLPVGPIKLVEETGIDVVYSIWRNRGEAQQTLKNFYEDGRYGFKKCGKGIYQADGSVDPAAISLIHKREPVQRSALEMTTDLLKDQITIAKDLLKKGVVDSPQMIDIGMLYGTGYPQDKGGPLKWADLIGLSEQLFGEKFYP